MYRTVEIGLALNITNYTIVPAKLAVLNGPSMSASVKAASARLLVDGSGKNEVGIANAWF